MTSRIMQAYKAHRLALPWVLFKKSFAKIARVETLVFFAYPLRTSTPQCDLNKDSALRIIPVDDLRHDFFVRLCQKYPGRKFSERLQSVGQQCFIAVRNEAIAGFAWTTRTDIYLDEIARVHFVAHDEAFIYDCFVEPEHRGTGIYPAMLQYILKQQCKAPQLNTVTIAAASDNRASMRGIVKAGFTEQHRIHYVRFRQSQRWWGVPHLG